MLASTFGPFALSLAAELTGLVAPGTSIHVLVSSNPGIATNSREFVLGLLAGFADSKIASAKTVYDLLLANALLTAVWPVHAVCFIAGTIYQILHDIYDTAATIIAAVGYLDEIIPFMCRVMQALPVVLGRLLDAESASDVAQLGRNLGQMFASSLEKDLPKITDASGYGEIASELIRFSYACGTWFGPLLLDIVLSFVGIGYVEGAVKLLGKAITCADDVLRWLVSLLRKLFDAVDPGLMDELIAFGAKLSADSTYASANSPRVHRPPTDSHGSPSRPASTSLRKRWGLSASATTQVRSSAPSNREEAAVKCVDSDPGMLFPFTFFWSMLEDADPITRKGLAIYDEVSSKCKLAGLHDFVPC